MVSLILNLIITELQLGLIWEGSFNCKLSEILDFLR